MSAITSTQLARYAIPEIDRKNYALAVVLVFSGAAARGELCARGTPFAAQVYDDLLVKAKAGGFQDEEMLVEYGLRKYCTLLTEEIAADMVECIGGHDAVLDIIDLHTIDETKIGAPQ